MLDELQREVLARGRGAVLNREPEAGGRALEVEVRVAPAMEVARSAQGLARTRAARILPRVMHQHDLDPKEVDGLKAVKRAMKETGASSWKIEDFNCALEKLRKCGTDDPCMLAECVGHLAYCIAEVCKRTGLRGHRGAQDIHPEEHLDRGSSSDNAERSGEA